MASPTARYCEQMASTIDQGSARYKDIGEYLGSFPIGSEVKFWTNQGEWIVRSVSHNACRAAPNYEVEWRPSDPTDGRVPIRSIMGSTTGDGEQARFIMEGGHHVKLKLDAQAQKVSIKMDHFYRVTFPVQAATPSGRD